MLFTAFKNASLSASVKNKKITVAVALACLATSLVYIGGQTSAVAPLLGTVENENMSVPAGGSVINDASASGGKALRLTQNNAYAQSSVNLTGTAVSLIMTARGDFCVGAWPKVSLYVDGTNVSTLDITSSTWASYSITISKPAGNHTVRAVMRNAKSDATCTRAAYLDVEKFYGQDVAPPPPADLTTESLAATPSSATTGQSISFGASVRNISANPALSTSNTSLRLDIGNDGSYDVNLANQPTAALAAGTAETENWPNAWVSLAGTHRFEACADVLATVTESDEANNCSSATFTVNDPPPDYVAENLSTNPANAETGQSVSFGASVSNSGASGALSASETSLRLDIGDDGTYDAIFSSQSVTALAAGGSQVLNWSDAWTASLGTHRFEVCADATELISESSESNNCSSATFTVSDPPPPPAPDYTAGSLATSPFNPETGQSVSFLSLVNNQGNGDGTLASEASLRLDVGNDGTYDQTFTNLPISALAATGGEAANWSDAWTAELGTHRFEVCADASASVSESDETNNCTSAIFTANDPPPPPFIDYVSESLTTSPVSPITSQSISLLSMVRNQGTGDAFDPSEVSLRLDIGDDGTYDQTLANLPVTALVTSASEAANWADVWVAELGTHRFEVCADALNAVTESDETNNCTSAVFTVNDPPPPPPTLDFSASPANIVSGGESTLTWSAANVTTCTASGSWSGDRPLSGSESTGVLSVTQVYTLTCDGPYGSVAKDVTVTVEQPPPPLACTIADTTGCVPGFTINRTDTNWVCDRPLSSYGQLPIKVILSYTTVYSDTGVDMKTGCAGDSDPNSIDLILDVQGDGLTYGPGTDGVKVRQQAGYNASIQVTGHAECGPRSNTDVHQDGVQAQGGRNITFVDFNVGNYDAGLSTCQGAGGGFFFSGAGGYSGENIHVIRGKYIACNKGLTTGSSGNSGSVTDAYFRSGRTDGTDPKCIGINGPTTCGGTGAVVITNVSCQRWNSLQQTFLQLVWP